jgi:hypothetical protein
MLGARQVGGEPVPIQLHWEVHGEVVPTQHLAVGMSSIYIKYIGTMLFYYYYYFLSLFLKHRFEFWFQAAGANFLFANAC